MTCRIESIDNNLIIWVDEDTPYIYKNTYLKSISNKFDRGNGEFHDIKLNLIGMPESTNGTIKIKFNDGKRIISVKNYIAVRKDYGSLEDMSFEGFKERLLVLEI